MKLKIEEDMAIKKYFVYYLILEGERAHSANMELLVDSDKLTMKEIIKMQDFLMKENKKEFPAIRNTLIKNIIKLDNG